MCFQLIDSNPSHHTTLHEELSHSLAIAVQGVRSPTALDPWLDMPPKVTGHGEVMNGHLNPIVSMLVERHQTSEKTDVRKVRTLID